MRRLFQFLKKFNFALSFLILEILSIILLVYYNNYQHSVFFNGLQEFTGSLYNNYYITTRYFSLKKENERLLYENAILQSKLNSFYFQNNFGVASKIDSSKNLSYIFYNAGVIYNSVDKRNNILTLHLGSDNGINKKMGVVSNEGVVGIISNVSKHYSLVMSILNGNFRLNAKISELNEVGSVIWDGISPSYVLLKEIPNHIKIVKGMHIVVGPYSHFFPENFAIGTIEKFKVEKGGSFFTIYVKLSADLRNVTSVYVIKKKNIDEQINLEKQIPND